MCRMWTKLRRSPKHLDIENVTGEIKERRKWKESKRNKKDGLTLIHRKDGERKTNK